VNSVSNNLGEKIMHIVMFVIVLLAVLLLLWYIGGCDWFVVLWLVIIHTYSEVTRPAFVPDPLLCCWCFCCCAFGSVVVGYDDICVIGLWSVVGDQSHITQKLPIQHLCQTCCCVVVVLLVIVLLV